jgi:hypothetical protein
MLQQEIKELSTLQCFHFDNKIKLTSKKTKNYKTYTTTPPKKIIGPEKKKRKKKAKFSPAFIMKHWSKLVIEINQNVFSPVDFVVLA